MAQIFEEVRCDYECDNFWYVDAWLPNNEQGITIAYIDALTARVVYSDARARYDSYAQSVITASVKKVRETIERDKLIGVIEEAVNHIFYEYENMKGIGYGDVSPLTMKEISELEERLADIVIDNFRKED